MKIAFRSILGLVFIASAVLKLFPIEFFELLIMKYINIPYITIPFVSRTLVGLELCLGLFLVLNYNPKQITYLSVFVLLIFFSLILLVQLQVAEDENCGCFGELLPMTPQQSLVKNILMLAMVIFLFLQGKATYFSRWWIPIPILLATFILPYPISPILIGLSDKKEYQQEQLFLENFEPQDATSLAHLTKGKYLVPLLSLSCQHCRSLAKQLNVIAPKHPELQTFSLLAGPEKYKDGFFTETEFGLDYRYLADTRYFLQLSEGIFPTLLLIENGKISKKWHGSDFNYFEIGSIIDEAKSS